VASGLAPYASMGGRGVSEGAWCGSNRRQAGELSSMVAAIRTVAASSGK
jgi:hypothetical protein